MEKSELFLEAVKTGDVDKVKSLLAEDKSLMEAKTERSETPFILAAHHDQVEVVDAMIELGFSMDFCEAVANGHTEIVKKMIIPNPDLNAAFSKDGWSGLQLAAYFGHADELDLLIGYGCDLDARSKSNYHAGTTALLAAIAAGYDEFVDILCGKGANPNVADDTGATPMHAAAAKNNAEVVGILLERHADSTIKNKNGKTALDIAIDGGHEDVAVILRDV